MKSLEVHIKWEPDDEKVPLSTLDTNSNRILLGEDAYVKCERLCQDQGIKDENVLHETLTPAECADMRGTETKVKRQLDGDNKPALTDTDWQKLALTEEKAKEPGCDEVPDVEHYRLADENLQLRATVEDLQNQLRRAEASRRGCCIM